ncbi:hypothetical protein Misp06_00562 [Microbulbifer sp. NBRC 101763]
MYQYDSGVRFGTAVNFSNLVIFYKTLYGFPSHTTSEVNIKYIALAFFHD